MLRSRKSDWQRSMILQSYKKRRQRMDNNYLSVCQQLELSGLLLLENKMGSEQSLLEEVKFLQPLSFSFIERCRPASTFF